MKRTEMRKLTRDELWVRIRAMRDVLQLLELAISEMEAEYEKARDAAPGKTSRGFRVVDGGRAG